MIGTAITLAVLFYFVNRCVGFAGGGTTCNL